MDDPDGQDVSNLPKPPRRNGKRNSVVTDEHVRQFAGYMEEWQMRLNLGDWRIEPSGQSAGAGAMAQMHISPEDRLAVWSVGKSFGALEPTPEMIERTAIHELMHVVLAPIKSACASRDEARATELEHGLITLFERLLYRGKHHASH